MNSRSHKRLKIGHPENYYDELKNSLQITDYATDTYDDDDDDDDDDDSFAFGGIYEEHQEDEYGSVTKECRKLLTSMMLLENHLIRMKSFMANISTDSCKLTPTNPQICPCDKAIITVSPAEDKIISDVSYLQTKGSGPNDPMIVIDSDEEVDEFLNTEVGDVANKQLTIRCSANDDCFSAVPLQIIPSKTMKRIQSHSLVPVIDADSCIRLNERPGVDGAQIACGSLVVNETKEKANLEIQPFPGGESRNGDEFDSKEAFYKRDRQDDDASGSQEGPNLDELWKEMAFALEYSKGNSSEDASANVAVEECKEDCEHDYLLKDDVGLVCQICGLIKKSITTIFDYQWRKGPQSTKTQTYWSHKPKDTNNGIQLPHSPNNSEDDFFETDLIIHPWHMKQMKPHQVEGFNFLKKNLTGDNPRGCILAHAPGSGKTFMLISFIQSFLASFPSGKPLIVLPKGILPTWKREFKRWQVEDITLYDLYSTKTEGRSSQLEVLARWKENQSVLLMGYKQFSNIISDLKDKVGAACQEILLKVPSLLILDEGHTPRNKDTEVLSSLAKVQTPRKVVLSGTLFQNHIKEVFNILNLVRQNFLKIKSSRAVVMRVLGMRSIKTDVESLFFELVEDILLNDNDPVARIRVIRDLREMTKDTLHYHKGYFLEDLPGLDDYTVMLKLTGKQKDLLKDLESYEKFKGIAVGSSIFLHPCLKDFALHLSRNEDIDHILDTVDLTEGVKAKFVLDILSMADLAGERVLVFSQYILPLKFLERLVARMKGWRLGKETFVISGDTSTEHREWAMERFNNSLDAKVLFGSIKACGEGISLVGASRVVILDVHWNPSVSKQAIARAFRPGQKKRVFSYRLVAADSPEEKCHGICFRKEVIAKMWFEWDEQCSHGEFELERVQVEKCEDLFIRHHPSAEVIKALYRR